MKAFLLLFLCIYLSNAKLVSHDDIQGLFEAAFKQQLNEAQKSDLLDLFEIMRRTEHLSASSISHRSDFRTTLDCILCRTLFRALFSVVESDLAGDILLSLSDTTAAFCTYMGMEKDSVCKGYVSLNLPIISHIIRTTPEATPEAFCGLVLQNELRKDDCAFEDSRFEWEGDLPERTANTNSLPIPAADLNVVILTDTHIDPLYEAYGTAHCDEPTCCRRGQTPAQDYVYRDNVEEDDLSDSIVKDESGDLRLNLSIAQSLRSARSSTRTGFWRAEGPAGFWGDYRNCDTPVWAFDDVVDRIRETHENIDVIYYIGDTIDHGVWETTNELIVGMNDYLVSKIRSTFGDEVLVLPVIGNHDSQPSNQFASASIIDSKLNTSWVYEVLADKWSFYLPEDALDSFRERGGFSMLVRPGLRVVSINNNVAFKYNWWLVYDPLDAKNHLDYLIQELYKAERAGEKVHLLVHIPPGSSDLTYTWTREYNRIINRFTDTIAAEFNGHTHSDEFKIFYNESGTPINVAWGGGSATAYSNYNLNYKIVTFNGQSYEPENIVNYSYNLTEANLTPNERPKWTELYNLRETFNLTDLSSLAIDDLVHHMVTDKIEYFELYSGFHSKRSDARWPACSEECKLSNLCRHVVTVLWERRKCQEIMDLFYTRGDK